MNSAKKKTHIYTVLRSIPIKYVSPAQSYQKKSTKTKPSNFYVLRQSYKLKLDNTFKSLYSIKMKPVMTRFLEGEDTN